MNILYVHTHDSGRILSPYGYDVPTPTLKAFASESLLFENAYCVSPTCSPSRAAMLSGRYPHNVGMLGLAQRGFVMNPAAHLVPFLNQHGFMTALCGIQHEAGWYLDHAKGAEMIGYQVDLTNDNSGYRQEDLGQWDKKNAVTMAEWLKNYQDEKPFFASFGMYSTHRRYPDVVDECINENYVRPPYPIPDTKETRLDHARYMTSAKIADECIHTVLSALKESGHAEDTIILFTTDHGLANPFSKCTLFDSGIGVSLIMHVPNAPANGSVCDSMISHIDVFPTLCDLLKLEKPKDLDGVSFAECFNDATAKTRDKIYAEVNFHTSYEPIRCVRSERYKYIRYYDEEWLKTNCSNIDESLTKDEFMKADLKDRMKYSEALYDMIYDMGERNNCIEDPAYKTIANEMREALEAEMIRSNDPLINGNIEVQHTWKVNKKECLQASSKNPDDYVSLGQ